MSYLGHIQARNPDHILGVLEAPSFFGPACIPYRRPFLFELQLASRRYGGCIVAIMAPPGRKLIFDPIPRKVLGEWHIGVQYPNGRYGVIKGFQTEAEAKQWLGSRQCKDWIRKKGYSE